MARSMVLITALVGVALLVSGCATNTPSQESYTNVSNTWRGSEHPAVLMLFDQSDMATQVGNWSAALTYLDQARRIEPRNPHVIYRQAKVLVLAGDNARAKQLLDRARVFVGDEDDNLDALLYEIESQL